MKYVLLLAVCWATLILPSEAQSPASYFETINQIEKYARLGLDNGEPKPLLKAIKLLVDHPKVRPMNYERRAVREDYFNPYSLIKVAEKYARTRPLYRWRLNRLQKKLRDREPEDIATQTPSPEDVRIPGAENLFFKTEETQKRMEFKADDNEHIIMEFQLGMDIGIRAFNSNHPREAIATGKGGQVKRIEFDVKAGERYYLELFNKSGKTAMLRLAAFAEPR